MTGIEPAGRRGRAAFRTVITALGIVGGLTLVLTACGGDDGPTAAPSSSRAAAARPSDGNGAKAVATPPSEATAVGDVATSPTAAPAAVASPSPSGPDAEDTTGVGTDCDHKMPISPDEIAVLRYTPEGGSLSLIFQHGNWDCPTPDSDGPPFVTVGKETFLPLNQAAYITVTDPIVASTENQPIGVQEFLDWLEAHPNSGLVFTYQVGADGAIDSLEQVFTP
ncbi:hypothetical protein [Streptomyces cinereospinus]|uniref:hypothetical protein n=1 Tax=Streptomyces cinereospinus TaxID=285561 RepID=UPI0036075BB5